ncbi:MAG: phosphatidylserine/phosphatidylglycerophosphate/cardiolipin synthase family protein [Gammaproteobacteria bacterium]|nr:phosphatidylserine/phosphatidylglycerophosphate/cardiolipin synthase family protein [Gammaproteobacteria bacterium]MBQ0840046.1 phosphatidylserine/phosphatidylglycerophosphate/cardiolipin synthase family protein [Gammaproteobacteria bacterium]
MFTLKHLKASIILTALSSGLLSASSTLAAIGDENFETELDNLTNTTSTFGNELDILESANEVYLLRQHLMADAQQFINIHTWAISQDTTGLDTAAQLGAKATLDDVEVNFLYDALAQLYVSPAMGAGLRSLGINAVAYVPQNIDQDNLIPYLLTGSHKKSMIVDSVNYGLESVVGGRNIGDDYLTEVIDAAPGEFVDKWRDTDLLIRGPATLLLQQDFVDSFNHQTSISVGCSSDDESCHFYPQTSTENPSANANLRILHNDPELNDGAGVFQVNAMYEKLLTEAEYSIDIETPYFIPPPALLEAIYGALARGVRVRILTNDDKNNDGGGIVYLASAFYWQDLLEAGAEFYLWGVKKSAAEPEAFRQMHSKFIIVDDQLFMPGSWNFDGRAYYTSSEFGFATTDTAVVDDALRMWQDDLATIDVITVDAAWYDANFTWLDKIKMKFYALLSPIL